MTGFEQFCVLVSIPISAAYVLVAWADAWRDRGNCACATSADEEGSSDSDHTTDRHIDI